MSSLKDIIQNHRSDHYTLQKPYMIAEAGVNHEGSMDLAKRLIEEAKEGGAQAIKFQTYKAETIASKNSPSYWDLSKESTDSQFALFKKYDKFWKGEYEELYNVCQKEGIEFLSTPFDVESAKFLNEMMDVFKISSSDLNNLPFIDILCSYNKPILLSTGAAYIWETQRTVEAIKKNGNDLALLHCVLNYPTMDENANLGMILSLKKHFPDLAIGYSDHTLPGEMDNLIAALTMGAFIIEKHFTHDKTLPGNDHYHAMDKEDLKVFFKKSEALFTSLGSFEMSCLESEKISRKNARRSLVASVALTKGQTVDESMITWKRPGTGITPDQFDNLIGKKALEDIAEDTVLQNYMFE